MQEDPTIFSTATENELAKKIVQQVEFYFSPKNLDRDEFLKHQLNGGGFVLVDRVAQFKRLTQLTDDRGLVARALFAYSTLRLKMDEDGNAWVGPKAPMVPPVRFPTGSGPSVPFLSLVGVPSEASVEELQSFCPTEPFVTAERDKYAEGRWALTFATVHQCSNAFRALNNRPFRGAVMTVERLVDEPNGDLVPNGSTSSAGSPLGASAGPQWQQGMPNHRSGAMNLPFLPPPPHLPPWMTGGYPPMPPFPFGAPPGMMPPSMPPPSYPGIPPRPPSQPSVPTQQSQRTMSSSSLENLVPQQPGSPYMLQPPPEYDRHGRPPVLMPPNFDDRSRGSGRLSGSGYAGGQMEPHQPVFHNGSPGDGSLKRSGSQWQNYMGEPGSPLRPY